MLCVAYIIDLVNSVILYSNVEHDIGTLVKVSAIQLYVLYLLNTIHIIK